MARNAYSITRSGTKTFYVSNTTTRIFSVTQTAVVVYSTDTSQVKISSHTASFTPIDTSYFVVSSQQKAAINVWNGFAAYGRIEMTIGQGGQRGMLVASVTAYANGQASGSEKINFNFSQVW